jgi:hypothetical protein
MIAIFEAAKVFFFSYQILHPLFKKYFTFAENIHNMKIKFILLILSVLCAFFFSAAAQTETLNEILDIINKDSLKRTVQDMQDFESRLCVKTIGQNRQVAQYLVDRLQNYGIENARIDSFYVSGFQWIVGDYDQYMYNVIGTLPGTGFTDSTVIIGAHLDAISYINPGWILTETAPGADDNATGCAVMIEMARVMHEKNIKPHHNIDFMAYDAEEIGLKGAYYDAVKRKAVYENIIVMLNNDMVGNQPEDGVWEVQLRWYENSLDITEKAEEALYNHTTVIPVRSEDPNSQGSDSYPYYKEGYKVNFAIEKNFSPYYHSVEDLTEYLNFEFCRQIARMNFVLLDHYAGINLPLSIKQDDKKRDLLVNVFPNPTKGELRITNHELRVENIEIFDVCGKKVSFNHHITSSSNHLINISHLTTGVYFLRISTDQGVVNKKIIKQ